MNEKMYQIMKSRKITTAWIGVHRHVSGKFITVSGVDVSFTNWYPGKPDNYGGVQDCVEFINMVWWVNGEGAGRWNDVDCSGSGYYHICELKH